MAVCGHRLFFLLNPGVRQAEETQKRQRVLRAFGYTSGPVEKNTTSKSSLERKRFIKAHIS